MDNLASLQLPRTMLTPTVDLVPHDIRRLMMQQQSSKDRSEPLLVVVVCLCVRACVCVELVPVNFKRCW